MITILMMSIRMPTLGLLKTNKKNNIEGGNA